MDYKRITDIMNNNDIDMIIVNNQSNVRYISGYTGDTGIIILLNDKKYLVTDFRYLFQAKAEAKDYTVIETKNKTYAKIISEIALENGINNIGFENKKISYSFYNSISKELEGCNLCPLDLQLDSLRNIKTSYEIEQLKQAEHIADIAFSKVLGIIKPGVTELDVAAELEYIMKKNGGTGLSFDTIVASGINSSKPHAGVSSKKIENGDFVTMDYGCIYNGYHSDTTRTIVVGKANEEQKKVYNTVLKAQLEVLSMVKAGYTGEYVDNVARTIINEAGYEGCFGHGLGHSVGLDIHEEPRFSPSEKNIVPEGVVITVEPGIYIENFGGVRIEDMILVTKDGHVNFTESSKELIEI
ncbi:MAG: Xaa-Pro peptidase family protein [Lachnospiraceae bacterium]|nr:Xaa-Pro peptidase family protein [Lachnospiraceae bacterium]